MMLLCRERICHCKSGTSPPPAQHEGCRLLCDADTLDIPTILVRDYIEINNEKKVEARLNTLALGLL